MEPEAMSDIKTFSQALPVLAAHGMEPVKSDQPKLWRLGAQTLDKGGVIALARQLAAQPTAEPPIVRGSGYRLSTAVEMADAAATALLPTALQDRARRYVAARRRSGDALLEAVAELAAAREEAQHGAWGIFLEAIGLDDATARAQIRIHEAAAADPLIADRIRTGWLSEATARELLPAPPEVRAEILAQPDPPTRQAIREKKARDRAPAPDLPAPAELVEHALRRAAAAPPSDAAPHLPPAAAWKAAQQRAAAIGLRLAMDARGSFSLLNDRGSGVQDYRAWPDILAHLAYMEASHAQNEATALPALSHATIRALTSAGAGYNPDTGTVYAPKGSGEAPAVLDEAGASAAVARWAQNAPRTAPEAPGSTEAARPDWWNVGRELKAVEVAINHHDQAAAIAAALALASALAPARLHDLADRLDDRDYETLALYRDYAPMEHEEGTP